MKTWLNAQKVIWKYIYKQGYKQGYKKALKSSKTLVDLNNQYYKPLFHHYLDVLEFAVEVNIASYQKYNPPSKEKDKNKLSRTALYKIGGRAIELYRSIQPLCENGRASTTPTMLRSLLENYMHYLIIINKDSDYMAFKFFVSDYINDLIEPSILTDNVKLIHKQQIELIKDQVEDANKKRAQDFINQSLKRKHSITWYKAEYKYSDDILSLCKGKDEMIMLYKVLSMAVHGTYIGSTLFKDKPDDTDINPREDKKGVLLALTISTTILLGLSKIRNEFERLGLDTKVTALASKKSQLASRYPYPKL
jgi:hypothetical protein